MACVLYIYSDLLNINTYLNKPKYFEEINKRVKINLYVDEILSTSIFVHYGNTGCGLFKPGVQNKKDFCLRINILKGNY